uniref:Uncharacterized protein n=1 Tax=Anguilla anguilla TaxID=7936 RepID=A0A0E9RQE7_ANGAN
MKKRTNTPMGDHPKEKALMTQIQGGEPRLKEYKNKTIVWTEWQP